MFVFSEKVAIFKETKSVKNSNLASSPHTPVSEFMQSFLHTKNLKREFRKNF